jgi:hypothetical protein
VAGAGKQMAPCPNWTHHESISGGGVAGCGSGERRRAMTWQHARFGSGSSEGEGNVGQQVAVGASLEPREGARRLGRRRKLAEGCAPRGGGNGGRRTAFSCGRR